MKERDLSFSFEFVNKPNISKEINKLDSKEACQEHDIPVKLIKPNKNLFYHLVYHNFNDSLFSYSFPSSLKVADILPTRKKKGKTDIENLSVFFIRFLRYVKDLCMTKFRNTFTKLFLNINAVFSKVIILNIVY